MKKLAFIIIVISIACMMHFNLPPNDIKNHVDLSNVGILSRIAVTATLSQTVSQWQYYNFFVVKFAYSETFDKIMIGLPFCKWKRL